jgi:carbon storage regulator
MLILSRKLNESIVIDGRIVVKILRIDKDTVKLGIQAPTELSVHRQEVYDAIQRAKQSAGGSAGPDPSTPKTSSSGPKIDPATNPSSQGE